MKFTVKTINSAKFEFEVDDEETVESLKSKIQEKANIPVERQRLIFLGKVLQNNKKLSEYNVDGKVLHLVECQTSSSGSSSSSSRSSEPAQATQTTRSRTVTAGFRTGNSDQLMNALGADANQLVGQIMRSLGVDASQASVTRQNLDNGSVAVNFSVGGGTNDQFDIQVVDGSATSSGNSGTTATNSSTTSQTSNSSSTSTSTSSSTTSSTSSTSSSSTSSTTAGSGTSSRRQGPPANLDRIINHLRSVRNLMQHVNCTAPEAQDIINNTLIAPCIRGPHTAGPTAEEGATADEVQQRASSRESLETYSHILIDMSDIMQEMVRYMNQYARLLHRDPPLEGGALAHCQNLVDRMGSMFHEVSHAFHLLSDYSITLNSGLPRRLWMAQLTGAHVVVSNRDGAVPQQLRQELTRLRNEVGQMAGRVNPTTGATTTSSSSTSSSTSHTTSSATRSTPSTTTTQNPAAGGGGLSDQSVAISFDIPLGGNLLQGGNPHEQIQQLLQNRPRASNPGALPRPSLTCNSRHRIYTPVSCPVHQPSTPPRAAHAHTHGPRHGHTHSHGPRPHSHGPAAPRQPAAAQPAPRTTSTTPPPPPPPPPPPQVNPLTSLLMSASGGDQDPEQLTRYMNLAIQMMNGSRQNQPISTHWPQIRALMMPSVTIPDNSALGEMLHIIASSYSFQEFMNALDNHSLFDILYRPMREHFNRTLFNNTIPEQAAVSTAVTRMIATDRNLIIAFFDIRQNESSEIDERSTVVAMVREFVNTVLRALYSRSRGDVAAGFGSVFGRAFLRFLGLIIAYSRYVNPEDPRNRLTNQMSGVLQNMIPFHTITRDELFDNYVVPRGSDDTEDEEFVDAEEGEEEEDVEMELPSSIMEEKKDVVEDDESPGSSSSADDELPDEVVLPRQPGSRGSGRDPGGVEEIPGEWKRVLEDDSVKLDNMSFSPLSEGYLNSLPAKRRKTNKKSSDNPEEVLKGLLKSSLPKNENVDLECDPGMWPGNVARDPELSEMFRAKLKEDLKKKVKDNADVNEEQFPSASKLKKS